MLQSLQLEPGAAYFGGTYIEYDVAVPSVELAMQRFCDWDYIGAHNTPDFQSSETVFGKEDHKLRFIN